MAKPLAPLALLVLIATAPPLAGCQRPVNAKGLVRLVSEDIDLPPQRVIEVTEATLVDLNMMNVRRSKTSIDGEFFARTALGREYHVEVSARSMYTTEFRIYGVDYRQDHRHARVIFDEVAKRLNITELASPAAR